MKYTWKPGMGEISGFGGSYEEACRAMVRAGLLWLDNHPEANPKFKASPNIYGIILEDNEDAEALSKAICSATDDATGAMVQATVGICLWVRKNGWERYVEEMSREED